MRKPLSLSSTSSILSCTVGLWAFPVIVLLLSFCERTPRKYQELKRCVNVFVMDWKNGNIEGLTFALQVYKTKSVIFVRVISSYSSIDKIDTWR
jgi:hypothetical protein